MSDLVTGTSTPRIRLCASLALQYIHIKHNIPHLQKLFTRPVSSIRCLPKLTGCMPPSTSESKLTIALVLQTELGSCGL